MAIFYFVVQNRLVVSRRCGQSMTLTTRQLHQIANAMETGGHHIFKSAKTKARGRYGYRLSVKFVEYNFVNTNVD